MASTTILSDNGVSSGSAGIKTTGGNDGVLILQTTTSGGTATNAVTIDTTQNVGIGASSNGAKLLIYNAAGTTNFTIQSDSTQAGGVFFNDGANSGAMQYLHASDAMTFRTASAEAARFDSSGNYAMGSTTTYNGGGFGRVMSIYNDTSAATSYVSSTRQYQVGVNTSNNFGVFDATASAYRLTINTSGYFFLPTMPTTANGANCNISTGEGNKFYISTSALKYKQDIRDIESVDINLFRPVRYKSKCEGDDQTKDFFGFIADEVHDAGVTELISYGMDGEVNGFQYDRLTVVLVKAIQEQQALITTLTERITALEAK